MIALYPWFLIISVAFCLYSGPKWSQRSQRSLKMSNVVESERQGFVSILRCDGLTKTYTEIPQFEDISFSLGRGQRVGLIGVSFDLDINDQDMISNQATILDERCREKHLSEMPCKERYS
jgi:hypothetical protein